MKTKHAIIDDKRWIDGEGYSSMNNHLSIGLDGLCEIAIRYGYTHLWIHPVSELRYGGNWLKELMQQAGYDCLLQFDGECNLVSLHGYKKHEKGRSHRFNIIFLEHSSWDWQELGPSQILTIVSDLELALGVSVGGSPSGVGMRFLEKVHENRKGWIKKPETDLSQIPWNTAARPIIWQRRPKKQELESLYLYAFDKNAAHPKAAQNERFGVGEPVHKGQIPFTDIPGMWKVDILFSPELDDRLPNPLWNGFEWLATPMVKYLLKIGCELEIQEAWIFEKYAYTFRPWVESLWSWRQESFGPEREAFKSIMNDTLGLTRSDKLGSDTYKYRPDWNMTVVAGTRAVMLYNIYKYAQAGYYPIMCQLDALYYLSSEEVPNAAVSGILDYCNSLGGYKLKFKLPLDDIIPDQDNRLTVRDVLSSALPQSRKLRLLNHLADKLGY